jgi:hypothetical protein
MLATAMLFAAGQAQWQMYRIGHERDPHPILKGVKDFTPPLLGTRKLAQFKLSSTLGVGSLCVFGAIGALASMGWLAHKQLRVCRAAVRTVPDLTLDSQNLGQYSI